MKTKKLVLTALFIALSFVGAMIKVPGTTIAFDSMPGLLGAILLGPLYGALIGALGHFLTAVTSGFPLTIPVHLILMVGMGITMFIFGNVFNYFFSKSYRLAVVISLIVAVLINGPLLTLALSPLLIPVFGKTGLFGMIPVLSGIAALNVIMAQCIYRFLPARYKLWK
jgi:uncharacterized membrane protein